MSEHSSFITARSGMGSSMWADGHQGRVSKRPSIAPSASKRPEAISGKGLMDEGRQHAITGVHPRYPIETSASQNLHESATYNMLAEMDAGIRAVQDENLKPKTSFNPKQNPNPSPVVSRGPRVQQPLILAGSSNSTERDAAEFPFGSKYPRGIRTKEDAMKYDKYKHFFETGSEGARDDASDAHNLQPKIQQQPAQGKLEPSKQVGLADEWSAPTTRYNPVGSPALDLSRQAAKNLQPQKPVANYAIKLWKNGFTIDDGPLYDISIPQNARFLTQIRRGIAPGQLMRVSPGQQVQVTLSEHGKPYPAAQSQSKGSEKPAPLSQKRDEAPSRQQGTPQPNAQEIGRRPTASRGAQPTQDPAPPKSSSHPPPNEVAPPIAPKKTISNLMSSVISTVHEQGYAKPPSRFEEKKAVTPIQPRKKNGQPFSISRTTTMYEETPEGRVVVDDDDWPKENRKTITNGLGLSLSTFEVVDNRPSHWQMASKGDPASSKPERATKAEPTLSSQKVAQGLCERVKDSKGKPENLTMDDKLVSWLNKGAAIHERLQKQDPRAKSRTPAQVWGRGLVGENRGNSPNTPSSTHFGDLAGLQQNRMTDSAEKRRKEQLSLDHDFAVALEIQDWQRADGQLSAVDDYSSRAHQVFTDHEIAMAEDAKEREVQRAGAIDSNVSRAIAARDPNAPVFVPDPEILKYIGEPGYAKKEEPEQLLCNICTSSKKSYHTFELLQAHKLQRHHYCAQCDIDFTDAETLHEHKDKTEQHWFCIICNFDFAAHESLVEHRKQAHPKAEAEIQCFGCSRLFISGAAIVVHLATGNCKRVSPEQFVKARFDMANILRERQELESGTQHIQSKRVQLARLTMMILGEERQKREYSATLPPNENPYSDFFNPTHLLNLHGHYSCNHEPCAFSSNSKKSMQMHLKYAHCRHLECPACNDLFSSPSAMIAHMETPSRKCNIMLSELYADIIRCVSGGYLRAIRTGKGEYRIVGGEPPAAKGMGRR